MKRMICALGLAAATVVLFAPACGGDQDCAQGFYYEPGCSDDGKGVLAAAGCYAPCTKPGTPCEGGTCRSVIINPCVCEPGQGCCAACAGSELLCVP